MSRWRKFARGPGPCSGRAWGPDRLASVSEEAREACGVFGVFAPGRPVAHLTYLGLYALQHRGQESAGMAVADGETLTVVKDMGLVPNVFDDRTLGALTGDLAIGHTRYSTTGSSSWRNAQPVYRDVASHEFALGHNGNLTNTEALADALGTLPGIMSSDSDVLAELLARHVVDRGADLSEALAAVLPEVEGAFSLVLLDGGRLYGVRDPNGFRPLCLGRLDGGWVLASETPALDIVGARFVRELEPGEVVVIDADGPRVVPPVPGGAASIPGSACSSSCTSPGPTPSCTGATSTPPGCGWVSSSPSRRHCLPTARRARSDRPSWSPCRRAACPRRKASPGPAACRTATGW